MSDAQALRDLMKTLAVELADWARTSQHLEAVCGGLADRCAATPAEIRDLQAFDQLSQHLGQLAHLCHDLGSETDHPMTVGKAIARLDLSDLKARLSRTEVLATSTGEAELW